MLASILGVWDLQESKLDSAPHMNLLVKDVSTNPLVYKIKKTFDGTALRIGRLSVKVVALESSLWVTPLHSAGLASFPRLTSPHSQQSTS